MNTFKRKALFTAVLAGLGAAAMAEVAYVHPNSGQTLTYPYYTAEVPQSPYNAYIAAVNGSDRVQSAFLFLFGTEENNRAMNVAASANSGGQLGAQGYNKQGAAYQSYTYHLRL